MSQVVLSFAVLTSADGHKKYSTTKVLKNIEYRAWQITDPQIPALG